MTVIIKHVDKVLLGAAVTLTAVCAYQNVYKPFLDSQRGRA